jgi:ABC-type sugar transport system permease subunit
MKKRVNYNVQYYWFVIPSLIFLALFTYYPLMNSVYSSFFKQSIMSPAPQFVGFANYLELLQLPLFWIVIKNNLIYAFFSIVPATLTAFILAELINECKYGKALFQISLFYPMMIPMAAAAMLWVFLYNPHIGLINHLLGKLGLFQPGWVNSSDYSLTAIIIMANWKNVGYYMMIYFAGLQNISREIYEAANLDGTGWWRRLWWVIFPLVGPTTLFVLVIAVIQSFRVFEQVYLMTQGGPGDSSNVLVYFIYENAFKYWDIGAASALTAMLAVTLILMVMIIFGYLNGRVNYDL